MGSLRFRMARRSVRAAPFAAILVAWTTGALAGSVAPASAVGAADTRYFDVRYNFNAVRVEAPVDIHISGMNPIRQAWTVAATPKDIAPPDLSFLNVGGGATSGTGSGKSIAADCKTNPASAANFSQCVDVLLNELNDVRAQKEKVTRHEGAVVTTVDALLTKHADLRTEGELKKYLADVDLCVLASSADTSCPSGAVSVPTILTEVQQLKKNYSDLTADYARINVQALGIPASDPQKAQLTALKADLDAQGPDITKLSDFFDGTLAPLKKSRFEYETNQECGGLLSHGRENQIVMTLVTNDTRDVTVLCPPPVFVSIGFGVDTLTNSTFTTIAPNTAGAPAPAAGATPTPSTIAQDNTGTRTLAVTLANVQLTPYSSNGAFYYSLGIGASVFGGSAGKVDLLTGLSWSQRRTVVATIGAAYGRTVILAPGYSPSGPILAGTNPPTLTKNATAFFAGISFSK